MVVVIVSGLVGVVLYRRYPEQMSRNRAQQTQDGMLEEIAELDVRALRIAKQLPPEFDAALRANIAGTRIGGGALAILSARDRSEVRLPGTPLAGNAGQERMLDWLSGHLSRSTDPERSRLINDLLSIVGARRMLLRRLQRDARMRGWLEAWLYLHVPVTFGLLGTLIAHVVSVFLYW
jgi:hypothetical protein